MRLALNYSPQAAALRQRGAIAFDCWKCPDWPAMIAEAGRSAPVYVHFPLQAGGGALHGADWPAIAALRQQTATPFVNLHLSIAPAAAPEVAQDSGDRAGWDDATQRLLADVRVAVAHIGAAVIVENVPYRGPDGGCLRLAVEPAIISAVVAATGCGLLLDLAHARITAQQLGLDARSYIAALPVQQLRELHITGVGTHEGQIEDHLPMTEADWQLAAWAFEQIGGGRWRRPETIALEYGGIGPLFGWRSEADVLARDVPRLAALCRTLIADR